MCFRFPTLLLLAQLTRAATAQYTIDFHDRSIQVRVRFPEAAAGSVTFQLQPWAGVSNFDRDIYRVSAVDFRGTALAVTGRTATEWVVENGGKPFELSYLVVSPKEVFMNGGSGAYFHATLLKDWVLAWGHAFVLLPKNDKLAGGPAAVRVEANEYGRAVSTLPAGGRLEHLRELDDQLFLAGAFRTYQQKDPAVEYYFANRAGAAVPDQELMDGVGRILRAQSRYMGTPPAPKVLVAVVDGSPSSTGGTHVKNSLVIYPDFTKPLMADHQATLRLAAHELSHYG